MFTYRKVGGLHHWTAGKRLGGSVYLKATPRMSPAYFFGLADLAIATGACTACGFLFSVLINL